MKKRTFPILCAALALLLIVLASAAGGDSSDPLISLEYLETVFREYAFEKIDDKIEKSDTAVYQSVKGDWDTAVLSADLSAGSEHFSVMTEKALKQGDTVSGSTGFQILPLAGALSVSFPSGAVVDATDGSECVSGDSLLPMHRYLVAENTGAVFTVSGKTAVVDLCGSCLIAPSDGPDYPAMAAALKQLRLFRGTDTAFGGGNDLEKIPTRVEALIMLIRLLGEESTALACTAPHPFSDVPSWATPYVAYAYEKGYSNGVGGGKFGTYVDSSALMYTEFVLRALGFSSTANTDISDALIRALSAGLLTDGECVALQTDSFLRADVVYLSFYALETKTPSNKLLCQRLISADIFTADEYQNAHALVQTSRIR